MFKEISDQKCHIIKNIIRLFMHYTFNTVLMFALYIFHFKFNNCNRMLKQYLLINYVYLNRKKRNYEFLFLNIYN
jgi:hypothetical protein